MTEEDHDYIEEEIEETRLQRMERLSTRQTEMYNDIQSNRKRNTLGFFIIVCLLSLVQYRQSQRTDDIIEVRTEGRIGQCFQDNIRIRQHNDLSDAVGVIQTEIDVIMAFSTTLPEGVVLTEEQQARYDSLIALVTQQKELVTTALATTIVPDRDCSTEGIEKYLMGSKKSGS